MRVTADTSDPRRFHAIDFATNRLVRSDDGGATFAPVRSAGLPVAVSPVHAVAREAANPLLAVPGRTEALWFLVGPDLYRSTDAGAHWTRATVGITIDCYGLGKAAPGSDTAMLHAIATSDGTRGIYRPRTVADQRRRTPIALRLRMVSGDPRSYGGVYVATDRRGMMYGDALDGGS